MDRSVLFVSTLMVAASLISVGCSEKATTRRAPAAGRTYPLWDGNESVADYAKRAGINDTEIKLTIGGDVTAKLTLIPAGRFLMGTPSSEKGHDESQYPQHEVTISRPFYMGVYSVTQAQWKSVMGNEPWKSWVDGAPQSDTVRIGADYPATYVSWDDAVKFCKKVSKKTDRTVRLPTEAERE